MYTVDAGRLREIILREYHSIRAFERAAGMNHRTMANILGGITRPTYENMCKIKEAAWLTAEETGEVFFCEKT